MAEGKKRSSPESFEFLFSEFRKVMMMPSKKRKSVLVTPPKMDDSPSPTKFTWKIKGFSKLNDEVLYSKYFPAGGYKWGIRVYPKGNKVDCLSIYLYPADWAVLPDGWSIHARFSLRLINQLDTNKTRSKETQHKFTAKVNEWGYKSYITLEKLNDLSGGYIVNDAFIIEAEVSVTTLVDVKKETVTQSDASTKFEIQCLGTNSRKSFISPPPANIPKPSSTLKNRSNISCTLLQLFMSEFDSDIPTYEKFGKIMENLRTMMYGGNMGDIFEEWRPRIVETEVLLAEIEDMEQESKENQETPLLEALSNILESLTQSEKVATQAEEKMTASISLLESKRQELQVTLQELEELRLQMATLVSIKKNIIEIISAEEFIHAKASSEKEEAYKKIKNLNQQKEDVSKNIGDVQDRAEVIRTALLEKKAVVQEWLSNPLPPAKNP